MTTVSYTVTGNLGRFVAGQKLTTDADVAEYYRAGANEGRDNGPITMSDKQVLQIVRSIGGDGEDQEIERLVILAKDVPMQEKKISAGKSSVYVHAIEMAAMADASPKAEAFYSFAIGEIDKADSLKRTPMHVRDFLIEIYGLEILNEFPQVGHPVDDAMIGKVNNPDRYKTTVNGRERTSSHLKDWAKTMRPARDIAAQIKNIELAEATSKDALPDYIAMGGEYRKSFKKTLETRATKWVAIVRDGLKLHQQLTAAESLKPNVSCDILLRKGAGGKLDYANTTYPMRIRDTSPEGLQQGLWQPMTISKFVGLDVVEAIRNGGTYEALLATAKRDQDEEEEENDDNKVTAVTFESYISKGANFLDDEGNVKAIRRLLNADAKTSNPLLRSLYAIHQELDRLLAPSAIKARISRMVADEQEEELKNADKRNERLRATG